MDLGIRPFIAHDNGPRVGLDIGKGVKDMTFAPCQDELVLHMERTDVRSRAGMFIGGYFRP